jgi:hypothetical protein
MQECIGRETPIPEACGPSSARFCYGSRVRCVSEMTEWGAHEGDTQDRTELLAALEAESEHGE